jgi:hypothetical protein
MLWIQHDGICYHGKEGRGSFAPEEKSWEQLDPSIVSKEANPTLLFLTWCPFGVIPE